MAVNELWQEPTYWEPVGEFPENVDKLGTNGTVVAIGASWIPTIRLLGKGNRVKGVDVDPSQVDLGRTLRSVIGELGPEDFIEYLNSYGKEERKMIVEHIWPTIREVIPNKRQRYVKYLLERYPPNPDIRAIARDKECYHKVQDAIKEGKWEIKQAPILEYSKRCEPESLDGIYFSNVREWMILNLDKKNGSSVIEGILDGKVRISQQDLEQTDYMIHNALDPPLKSGGKILLSIILGNVPARVETYDEVSPRLRHSLLALPAILPGYSSKLISPTSTPSLPSRDHKICCDSPAVYCDIPANFKVFTAQILQKPECPSYAN